MAGVLHAVLLGREFPDSRLGLDGSFARIRLRGGIDMVPLTEGLLDANDGRRSKGAAPELGFYDLSDGLRRRLVAASDAGPVAYIHLEFHGGEGFHSAVVWDQGQDSFGPRHTATPGEGADPHFERVAEVAEMAINGALRSLGVSAAGATRFGPGTRPPDEFNVVGLDTYRWTSEWLDAEHLE